MLVTPPTEAQNKVDEPPVESILGSPAGHVDGPAAETIFNTPAGPTNAPGVDPVPETPPGPVTHWNFGDGDISMILFAPAPGILDEKLKQLFSLALAFI